MKRSQEGSIEVLLLLSCMVGCIIFFCFALGVTAIVSDHPGFSKKGVGQLAANQQVLSDKKIKSIESLVLLKEQLKKAKKNIADKKVELNEEGHSIVAKEKVLIELASLTLDYNSVLSKIEVSKKKKLDYMILNEQENATDKMKLDLRIQREELDALDRSIQSLKNEVITLSSVPAKKIEERNTVQNVEYQVEEGHQAQMERLKKIREELLTQLKKEKVRVILKGADNYENPLFVECGNDFLIFYPDEEKVSTNELDKRNVFFKKSKGHDITVLLVRPDGFDTFNMAYTLVKDMKIRSSYEPVDSIYSLDFLKRSRGER